MENYPFIIPSAAAKRGAELLDRRFPLWWNRIDLDTLDISDGNLCVLGQVFGEEARVSARGRNGFTYGYRTLGLSSSDLDDYGFVGEDNLNGAWRVEINKRRAANQGRANGMYAYREATDRVAYAAESAGINLTYRQVIALTDALEL